MFYYLLKIYARLAIRIYCKKIRINEPGWLKEEGPLLLACNHPNSFLDGMILTTLFDQPVYSLARGDAFRNRKANRFLRSIRLLPVYRTSEGVENLGHNYTTFESCRETFQQNGIVLIFSEGRCENEWHLRPLKKGTARLAITSWEMGIPLKVLPVALNYSSFTKFGKEVHLYFGKIVDAGLVMEKDREGRRLREFNRQLEEELSNHVYEINAHDNNRIRECFGIHLRPSFALLLLPAIAGWLLHAPFFYACKLAGESYRKTGHYDSVVNSLLLLLYPLYLLLLVVVSYQWIEWWSSAFLILAPFLAWCCVQVKYQIRM